MPSDTVFVLPCVLVINIEALIFCAPVHALHASRTRLTIQIFFLRAECHAHLENPALRVHTFIVHLYTISWRSSIHPSLSCTRARMSDYKSLAHVCHLINYLFGVQQHCCAQAHHFSCVWTTPPDAVITGAPHAQLWACAIA